MLGADVAEFMGDEAGDQADTQFQKKSLGCVDDVIRIQKVSDRHTDGAAKSAIKSSQQQCS